MTPTIVPSEGEDDGAAERGSGRRRRGGLWVRDEELIEILGVPEKDARAALRMLDHNPRSGFPRKQPLWGGRRYLPAVRAYFDAIYGCKIGTSERRGSHAEAEV